MMQPSSNSASPRQNVELKARYASLERAREIAEGLSARRQPDQHQCDTYFFCRDGRLKLREIDGREAQLISYSRPDETGPKSSRYYLVPVPEPDLLKQALTDVLGVRAVVDKQRTIYLYQNVRIHLDEVRGLGSFIEFEAVLEPDQSEADGQPMVDWLQQRFGIRPEDLLTGSYGEMVDPSSSYGSESR